MIVRRLPGKNSHFLPVGDVPFEHAVKYLLDNWFKIRADLIHVHDFEGVQIGLMLKTAFGIPLIMTVHRTPKEPDPTLPQRDVKDCYLRVILKSNLVDKLIAPSNAYRSHLLSQGFDHSQVETIYHGVPVQSLLRLSDNPEAIKRLALDEADELVLCPIRLDPHKRPETFIEAAAIVKNQLKSRRLVFAIAGSGTEKYRKELAQRAYTLGVHENLRFGAADNMDFLPNEMPTLYRRARVCVLPSTREGFGQVLLEAAVFKSPVVAANTGGIPEVVIANRTGLLFNRDEPADLAQQIRRLLEDEYLSDYLTNQAAVEVARKFDAGRMAKDYLRVYQRVTGISLK